ncbi:OmpA family protein [Novosphingobium lentum]|uniref:OmpA family protein n=1 Tax=Novosphingobium lentum TaxID=145287 RepID=UPI000A40FEAC|nr:OmpA family protein [Novosphingobium lentum]
MRSGASIALLAILTGCAAPSALLLPGEDGHPTGALAVLDQKGGEQLLDTPLASARMSRGGATLGTAAKVKPAYRQLMATLPPPARSFTLYFVEGTTTMVESSRPMLDQIRAEIARRPGAEVQVTGHTDTLGSDDDNDRLSRQRAGEIMSVLIAEGFPRDLLSAVGRGEREPAVDTGDGVRDARNRRVEVIVR